MTTRSLYSHMFKLENTKSTFNRTALSQLEINDDFNWELRSGGNVTDFKCISMIAITKNIEQLGLFLFKKSLQKLPLIYFLFKFL